MKIESLIKRKGGTHVEMDAPKRNYHFAPVNGEDGPHIADVNVDSHAKAFLRIREGFRLADGEEAPELGNSKGKQEPLATLKGSNVHNATYEIKGGDTIELGDLVHMAFEDSGLEFDQWQELADQERYDYIDATLRELQLGEGELDDDHPQPDTNAAPVQPESDQDVNQPAADDKHPTDNTQPEDDDKPADDKPADDKPAAAPIADGQQDEKPADAPPVVSEQPEEVSLKELPRKELAAMFQKRFGRQPSTRMTIDDIANALSEEEE